MPKFPGQTAESAGWPRLTACTEMPLIQQKEALYAGQHHPLPSRTFSLFFPQSLGEMERAVPAVPENSFEKVLKIISHVD